MIFLAVSLPFLSPRLQVDVSVVTEDGKPIPEARVLLSTTGSVIDRLSGEYSQKVQRLTDKNGRCVARLAMYSSMFNCHVEADGFYPQSVFQIRCIRNDDSSDVRLDDAKMTRIVMRKKINPDSMVMAFCPEISLPRTNGTWYVDLERLELMPPDGNGRIADAAIVRDWNCSNGVYRGELKFLHGGGAYKLCKKKCEYFNTEYHADVDAVFYEKVVFTGQNIEQNNEMSAPGADEYIVYCIRVKKKDGRIVSSNYGKIYGELKLSDNLIMGRSMYNPRVNDTNLEDDPDRNIKIEDYRRMLDEAEKAAKKN